MGIAMVKGLVWGAVAELIQSGLSETCSEAFSGFPGLRRCLICLKLRRSARQEAVQSPMQPGGRSRSRLPVGRSKSPQKSSYFLGYAWQSSLCPFDAINPESENRPDNPTVQKLPVRLSGSRRVRETQYPYRHKHVARLQAIAALEVVEEGSIPRFAKMTSQLIAGVRTEGRHGRCPACGSERAPQSSSVQRPQSPTARTPLLKSRSTHQQPAKLLAPPNDANDNPPRPRQLST